MTEAEILRLIRRVSGISQQADEQTTQPDSVTAENYARVVAEVMRRDGIQLNDADMRDIRIRVLEMLAYNRALNCIGRRRKSRTTGRSRSGYGGNSLRLKQSAKLRWLHPSHLRTVNQQAGIYSETTKFSQFNYSSA